MKKKSNIEDLNKNLDYLYKNLKEIFNGSKKEDTLDYEDLLIKLDSIRDYLTIFAYSIRNGKNGLYPDEVMDLMKYIQKNNSWQNMYDNYRKGKEIPKYYTMRVDTRTGTVWSITFDHLIYDRCEKSFRTEQNYNFKKAIYEFLDRERKTDDA